MCTSQYGILIVKNPILLQNFTNENDGLIEHSQESYKFEIVFYGDNLWNFGFSLMCVSIITR